MTRRPTVFCPMTAVRPGNSSGLMPVNPSHRNVFDSPSKETAARASSTKNTPLTGSGSASTSATPEKASDNRQDLPSGSQRSGASSDTRRKNKENGSAFPSQLSSPNTSAPANIAIQ